MAVIDQNANVTYRTSAAPLPTKEERVNTFMRNVYAWMAGALALTAGVATLSFKSGVTAALVHNPAAFLGLLIFELLLVFGYKKVEKSLGSVGGFLTLGVYAGLNGVTISTVLLQYTAVSVVATFGITSGMFLAMVLFGTFTRINLQGLGPYLFMGLIGLIIAMVVNIFIASSTMGFVVSCAGVLIFTLLTAYDAQVVGNKHLQSEGFTSLDGALELYLDFVNLFLYLLRIFGVKTTND